jgi:hypothetical protein
VTTFQFAPSNGLPFRFNATLLGPTTNVTSLSTTFTVTVPWLAFGQRFYVQIQDANGVNVLYKPLIASPDDYMINLVAGYFSGSSLVFFESSSQFVVTP